MQIYLSKPGGQREGPYTLEQILRDLAASNYRDSDYWAWHEGLPEWVPLYLLPGISNDANVAPVAGEASPPSIASTPSRADAASPDTSGDVVVSAVPAPAEPQPHPRKAPAMPAPAAQAQPENNKASAPSRPPAAPPATPAAQVSTLPVASPSEPEEESAKARQPVAAGLPTSALEEVFMFTTGDGPTAWQSPTAVRMLQEIIGEDPAGLREGIQRDVIGRCVVGELLKPDGAISDAVWRAMAAHRPAIVQQARERLYRVCVRTFRIEADAMVAVVLFYNKQKL
jgi:hypothetical protein